MLILFYVDIIKIPIRFWFIRIMSHGGHSGRGGRGGGHSGGGGHSSGGAGRGGHPSGGYFHHGGRRIHNGTFGFPYYYGGGYPYYYNDPYYFYDYSPNCVRVPRGTACPLSRPAPQFNQWGEQSCCRGYLY